MSGNGSRTQDGRLLGWGMLFDDVTVTAPWIERRELQQIRGWVVHNVTMAVPHPGVVSAALDPTNDILQPNERDGLGIYTIRASVPSPFVNVICAMGMAATDLDPVMDNSASNSVEETGTELDEVFRWGPQYGQKKWPPLFMSRHLPAEHNPIVNDTVGMGWGQDSLYILGRGGAVDQSGVSIEHNFALCSLRVGLTPDCSTVYNATTTGGDLVAICEDPADTLSYRRSTPKEQVTSGNATLSSDWVNVGSE